MQEKFIHLRLHTEYSLSNGLIRIPALMQKAEHEGFPAIGISDLSNLYAAIKFYQAAFKAGIKPLIGADLWIDQQKLPPSRLTVFCQNQKGYQHLLQLISRSYLENQSSGKPLVKREWLEAHSSDLIALSGGEEGDVGQAILNHEINKATDYLMYWVKLFPNRFYIELSRVGKPTEAIYIQAALALAETHAVPVVATNDVYFLEKEDFEAHEARVAIQEGTILNDAKRVRHYTENQYFRSIDEMEKLFADIPESLSNTIQIAKRCNLFLNLGKNFLPNFPVPNQQTIESYLSQMAEAGLEKRLQTANLESKRKAYEERLALELNVINKMGFAGYFLVVADFTKWAKENGIPVGPGRGSGPGSLVAYCLYITDLDPLQLELLFERFLNPERVSMPDFDIDLAESDKTLTQHKYHDAYC